MTIKLDGQYTTRDGRAVRIFMVDGGGDYPIIGAVYERNKWQPTAWAADGRIFLDDYVRHTDLIEVPEGRFDE